MRLPWRRNPKPELLAQLRDFVDATAFATGRGFASTLTAGAALRRHGGWLAIAVRPVVDRIAGLTWQALSDADEEIEKSPLVELLHNPSPMCGGGLFLRILAQQLVLAGECYALKVRGRRSGRPVQLVPVSPDRVARVWGDGGSLEYHVAPGSGGGEPEVHPAEDVLRVWRPLPSDPWEPYGVASMVAAEIDAEAGWRESVAHWFSQDARPAMALEWADGDLAAFLGSQTDGWQRYLSDWHGAQSRRRGGLLGAPVPLPPGSKLRELSGVGSSENIGPTELALRSKILSALGVPPFLLGAAHEANRASAEASLWAFDFSAVKPWTELLVCAVNHQLGPDFPGQRVQFRDWVWRDRLAESEIDSALLDRLVVSPNEVREKRNMPPASWGELPVGQRQDVPYDGEPRVEPPSTSSSPLGRSAALDDGLADVLDAAREAARLLGEGGDASRWRAALRRVEAMAPDARREFRAALAAEYFPSMVADPAGARELAECSFLMQAAEAAGEA